VQLIAEEMFLDIRSAIFSACEKHKLSSLFVYGSAQGGDFAEEKASMRRAEPDEETVFVMKSLLTSNIACREPQGEGMNITRLDVKRVMLDYTSKIM